MFRSCFAAALIAVANAQEQVPVVITNKLSSGYMSTAYLGSPQQDSITPKFYYNWSESASIVTLKDCVPDVECQASSQYYDPSASSTATETPTKTGTVNGVEGTQVADVICVQDNATSCTKADFIFYNTYSDTGDDDNTPQNGIIGIGMPSSAAKSMHIAQGLFDSGATPEASFSLAGRADGTIDLSFGGFTAAENESNDLRRMVNDAKPTSGGQWSMGFDGDYFGSEEINEENPIKPSVASQIMFSQYSDFVILPETTFNTIKTTLGADFKTYNNGANLGSASSCDTYAENGIFWRLQAATQYTFVVGPQGYLLPADSIAKAEGINCMTFFQNSGQADGFGFYTFGKYFLNQFAFKFDLAATTVTAQLNTQASTGSELLGALSGLSVAFAAAATALLAF